MRKIILEPIITEKSMQHATQGWYTFKVAKESNKRGIADAVSRQFKVNGVSVKTMLNKGKTQRVGKKRSETVVSSWKKALVKLKKEQKIELFNFSQAQK